MPKIDQQLVAHVCTYTYIQLTATRNLVLLRCNNIHAEINVMENDCYVMENIRYFTFKFLFFQLLIFILLGSK